MAFRPASVICSLATSLPARARDDALRRGRGEPGVNQKFSQCFVNPITLPCVSRPTLDLLVTFQIAIAAETGASHSEDRPNGGVHSDMPLFAIVQVAW
jgi:hypothetical protein